MRLRANQGGQAYIFIAIPGVAICPIMPNFM
jgi:hypothetical protein